MSDIEQALDRLNLGAGQVHLLTGIVVIESVPTITERVVAVLAPWTDWKPVSFKGDTWQAAANLAVEAMERPIT